MTTSLSDYKTNRRSFIIIPNIGIIWAQPNSAWTHAEILSSLDLPPAKQQYILKNFPRGYFADNTLVLYDKIEENTALSPANYSYVSAVWDDIKNLLPINTETKVVLDCQNKEKTVSLDFFCKKKK